MTSAIKARQFSKATTLKQELEEKQREKLREREEKGEVWHPKFFVDITSKGGQPELSGLGRDVLDGLQDERWVVDGLKEEEGW